MKGVDTRHKDYDCYAAKWRRCRDCSAGQDAVHKAGQLYLPALVDQGETEYQKYVKRAGFYNATWITLKALRGMMFRKPPTRDLAAVLDSYADDIDMEGTPLDTFARKVALEQLEVGRVGILVDHPAAPENVYPLSLAGAEQLGLRPMLKFYAAEAIINWRYARIANRWKLVRVVLEETVCEPDGEFTETEAQQWRVLELDESGYYRQQVWRKTDKDSDEFEQVGGDIYPMMANRNLTDVPFAIVGTDGIEAALDEPPLIDLVDANLDHYRLRADYRHGLHFTGLPTLFLAGLDPNNSEKFYIGSQAAILAPDPNAKGMFIEFQGQGLGAMKQALDDLKDEMATLGARMLAAEKRQVETAEVAAIHRTGENSSLSDIAQAISSAMEWALGLMAEWAGASGPVTYQLNRDYNPAMISAQQLTALLAAVQAGQLSEQELFDLLQRGDVIDAEQTFEAHQEQVASQVDIPRPANANDPAVAA